MCFVFSRSRMALQREVNLLMELHARTRAAHNSETLNLPHRIALPDGERGPDCHLQLRVPYQVKICFCIHELTLRDHMYSTVGQNFPMSYQKFKDSSVYT